MHLILRLYISGFCDKHTNCPQSDSVPRSHALQSDTLPLDHSDLLLCFMFHTSCVVYSQWSDTKLQVALVTRGLCLKVRLWYRIVQVLMMETTSTRSCWLASMSECERVSFSRVPTTSCKSSRWNRWFSARSRFATPVTCFVVSCLFLLYCILFVEKRSLPIVPHHISHNLDTSLFLSKSSSSSSLLLLMAFIKCRITQGPQVHCPVAQSSSSFPRLLFQCFLPHIL